MFSTPTHQLSPPGLKKQGGLVTSHLFGLFCNNSSLYLSHIFHLSSLRPFANRTSLILNNTAVRPLTAAVIPNLQMKKTRHRVQAFSLLTSKADDNFSWCAHYIHMTVVSNRPCCNNKQLLNSWNISEELFKLGKYKVRRPQRPSKKKKQASSTELTAQTHCLSHVYYRGQSRISGRTLLRTLLLN